MLHGCQSVFLPNFWCSSLTGSKSQLLITTEALRKGLNNFIYFLNHVNLKDFFSSQIKPLWLPLLILISPVVGITHCKNPSGHVMCECKKREIKIKTGHRFGDPFKAKQQCFLFHTLLPLNPHARKYRLVLKVLPPPSVHLVYCYCSDWNAATPQSRSRLQATSGTDRQA